MSPGHCCRDQDAVEPESALQRPVLVPCASDVAVLGRRAKSDRPQDQGPGPGRYRQPMKAAQRPLHVRGDIDEVYFTEPAGLRPAAQFVAGRDVRDRPAGKPAMQELFVSSRVRPPISHVLDNPEAPAIVHQSAGFLKERPLIARMADALDRPDDIETRGGERRLRVVLLEEPDTIGDAANLSEPLSPLDLARNRSDANHLDVVRSGEPDGAAPDPAAGVKDALAGMNANPLREYSVQAVKGVRVRTSRRVPVSEVDCIVGRVEPQKSVVEPRLVVVGTDGAKVGLILASLARKVSLGHPFEDIGPGELPAVLIADASAATSLSYRRGRTGVRQRWPVARRGRCPPAR